jgi:hypothetical protein
MGVRLGHLTLKEEYILGVFENSVLRNIFGSRRNQVSGGRRKLHIEKLHNLYSSPNIINNKIEDEMGRACSMNGGNEECM